jgi:transposase
LLRQGRRFPGNAKGWSAKFDTWVRAQRFDDGAAQLAFDHYLQARTARTVQLTAIDSEIEAAVTAPPLAEPVAHLRCLRGIDTLSGHHRSRGLRLPAFSRRCELHGLTGLVPSEHSSGTRQHRESITKTGNRHVRRVLIEAAWSYRHRPYVGAGLARRNQGQPHEVVAHCYHAQVRLNSRYWRLVSTRDSRVAVVAVARETRRVRVGAHDKGHLTCAAGGRRSRKDPRDIYAPSTRVHSQRQIPARP